MKKSALVVGGAGFIGSHLLKLMANSEEYELLVSADINEPHFGVEGVEYKRVDVRQPLADELCPGVTEIYNLAAVHTTPGFADWEYYWTNVLGATHVADFARRQGVRDIVFTSSIAVYGPNEELTDEDSFPDPEIAYGCSKLCGEKIHQQWQAERPWERRLVVVRPGVIYGYMERGNFSRLANLLSKGRFVFPGRTDTIKSCGYVKDLVRSMRFMLERCEGTTIYNFCHRNRYTTAEICRSFARVAGFPPAHLVVPLRLMLFAGWVLEMLAKTGLKTSINRARILKLVRSNNIVPRRLEEAGFEYHYDLDAALEDWKKDSPAGYM